MPGKVLIVIGSVILLIGLIFNYAPWLTSWFGHLPGDIRIEDERRFIFIPFTSMIIVSALVSLIMHLISYLK